MIDILGPEKRRRRTTQEKIAIVQQSFEPGMTVSLVARQHGVAASQLFLWRKQYQGKRKANAVCNTCSLQTKLELLLN
ncbi:transposase insC for insertion element IS2D [Escherichia coli HVH 25 (4-5851939)]|uniref:transposase n=1 Tax=Escherichia coli TaxID=562 RepID=UPI000390CD75|nr:transposase [Escherichia coli]EQN88109.1 transposase insC for insertion element IS2D [Escherichia coli HVH 25 (4-5851939)]